MTYRLRSLSSAHDRTGSRVAVPAFAGLVLLAALAGCGGSGSGGAGDVDVFSDEEATTALLTEDNLGGLYTVTADDEDDSDEDSLGCLSGMSEMEETDAPVEAERGFEMDNDLALPAVGSQVSSYDAVGDATDALDAFRSALEDCVSVDETDADGARTQLQVSMDEENSTNDADDQVNLVATGTVSSDGMDFPFGIWFTVVRVNNHVTTVGIVDLGDEAGAAMDEYVSVAVDRLVAVADGEEPDEDAVIVAAAGAGEGDTEPEDTSGGEGGEFTQLPLDGGTYTWSSGVTLTLSVERVEPWGDTDDFCGDGSCGVANPDDVRFVFKYEVSVPEDYPGPFDPSGCPGGLSVTTGNDDEALSGVSGDYAQYMDGKIFPGMTKFGVEEYYIEKAYKGEEFYIESTCGDVDYAGESAYFVGPIAKTA